MARRSGRRTHSSTTRASCSHGLRTQRPSTRDPRPALPAQHLQSHPRLSSIGEDVNFVNVPLIQATVAHVLSSTPTAMPAPVSRQTGSRVTSAHVVVDAVNASGRSGLAGQLERALTTRGFEPGKASTGSSLVHVSVIEYGAGAAASAYRLAGTLGGLPTQAWAHCPRAGSAS